MNHEMKCNKKSASQKLRIKGSSDPSHFIFEINVGKKRIRHRTTPKLNSRSAQNWLKMTSYKFRVVLCRIRQFPTLISKIKWLRSGLSLKLSSLFSSEKFRTNSCFQVEPGQSLVKRDEGSSGNYLLGHIPMGIYLLYMIWVGMFYRLHHLRPRHI